ncbi:hypothetical protein P9314_05125 [Paenibacillus validus]|nr:hypothetical protein [Paenibacillus validus]MED4600091.1 hypothetical protein [Paenibacillus validus]MED4605539.1 hypothetical protein [Paenibacillus validus]
MRSELLFELQRQPNQEAELAAALISLVFLLVVVIWQRGRDH